MLFGLLCVIFVYKDLLMRFCLVAIFSILLTAGAAAQTNNYKTISAAQADSVIKSHAGLTDLVILDVRGAEYFQAEHLEKAINFDVAAAWFNDSIDKIDKNKVCLVYCSSGGRSPGACAKMIAKNIKTVYNLSGGLSSWKAAGFPTVKGTGIDIYSITSLVVKIYPNPVVDLSTLEIDGFEEGEVKIEILNALGSLVMSRKMLPGRAITINGRELSPGLYFYRLVLPQNQVKSGRFQVAR